MIISEQYPHLSNEVEAIAKSWAGADFLTCLEYIYLNRKDYQGTACWKEFLQFTQQMGLMSSTKLV